MDPGRPQVPEFAHYYGDWIWDEELTGWIKSLLLFFDGIAMALPTERAERQIEANPVLAQPLAELGLLRNYDPDTWMKPVQELSEEEDRQLEQTAEILDLAHQDSDESFRKLASILESIEPVREFALRLARAKKAVGDIFLFLWDRSCDKDNIRHFFRKTLPMSPFSQLLMMKTRHPLSR